MGMPWLQIQLLWGRRHDMVALSSNYAPYGDMSNRLVSVLRDFSPQVEVYSIDESNLHLQGMSGLWTSPTALGQAIRQRAMMWVGLPVSNNNTPTKTKAKLAN